MSALQHGLSGFVPVRNNFLLDYCAELAVESLLPVCNEVIVCDSESTDNTVQFFQDWSAREPKIRIIHWPWPPVATHEDWKTDRKDRPGGDQRMLIRWLNFARQHCRFDTQISLDADEVLCPKSYPEIRRAIEDRTPRWFHRVNFWMDPFHEAPHGTVCGETVAKLGPTEYETVSDEPRPEGEPPMRALAIHHMTLRIFHLGFLRRPQAFLEKSKVMQAALHSTYDPRLVEAERTGRNWVELAPFDKPLLDYQNRDWPEYVRTWLIARGYAL